MAHHQQLLDWIEDELINQTLHLGDELPNDRVLARKVGISQNLMRESLKHCEEIGVLRLYEGRKKSIIGVLLREPASSAGSVMGLYLASSRTPRQDLLNTCLLLESYALSGPSYDESALPELDRIVEAMQDAGTSLSDFHDLEADFHIQLGRLSGNVLVSALLATLRDAMIEARFELVDQVPLWSDTSARLRMEYRAIVDAAHSGDPALAQTLLKANLRERFAEAGHQIDLAEDAGQENEEPRFTLEPVDIDAHGLVPDEWGGAIEPDLFQALTTIQPIKSPAPPRSSVSAKSTEQPAPQAVIAPEASVGPVPHTVGEATNGPIVEPDVEEPATGYPERGRRPDTVEIPESAALGEQPDHVPVEPDVPEQLEHREPVSPAEEWVTSTGSALRKRRGTVSPVVRATVIPPRQTTPKQPPSQYVADIRAERAENKLVAGAGWTPAQGNRAQARSLEQKLRQEEARLVAPEVEYRGKQATVATPQVPPNSGSVPVPSAKDTAKLQVDKAGAAQRSASSDDKRSTKVASKKLLDVVNYFGFKQVKTSVREVPSSDSSSDVIKDRRMAVDVRDVEQVEDDLLDGHEHIEPLPKHDRKAADPDGQEHDLSKTTTPGRDEASELSDSAAGETLKERVDETQTATPEPVGHLLGQKKGKKKSKKSRR